MTPGKILFLLMQVLFLVAFAPFVSGFIRKIKNNLRMRKGAGVFQPYYNLAKLFSKGKVISKNASWIFTLSPFIVLASGITACFLLPIFNIGFSLNIMGDALAIFLSCH